MRPSDGFHHRHPANWEGDQRHVGINPAGTDDREFISMTFTTLVTHVEPTDPGHLDATLATPLALAEAFTAHLTTLVFPVEAEANVAAMEAPAVARVQDAAARRGISCEVRARSSFAYGIGEVFVDHLRVADLGILTVRNASSIGQRMLQGGAIFDSGRPVLLVPHARPLATPPARIVIAWAATPAAVRAVHAALPFIRRAAETIVVTVTDDKEARSGQSGIELTHLLSRHGAAARFSAAQRGGGGVLQAVLAAPQHDGADMLVMGALRHSPLRNMVFGSATQDLLEHGPRIATLVAA
jgi:nucleotide-binding universal stress UspA family protein